MVCFDVYVEHVVYHHLSFLGYSYGYGLYMQMCIYIYINKYVYEFTCKYQFENTLFVA